MDHLKEGVGLRGYGGQDPKREYQREGYELFLEMNDRVREQASQQLFKVVLAAPSEERLAQMRRAAAERQRQLEARMREQHAASEAPELQQTVVRKTPKVGRNAPCPCGSGKKFKKCCGATS